MKSPIKHPTQKQLRAWMKGLSDYLLRIDMNSDKRDDIASAYYAIWRVVGEFQDVTTPEDRRCDKCHSRSCACIDRTPRTDDQPIEARE